jgi:type VI secretion system lysozyme-like protein
MSLLDELAGGSSAPPRNAAGALKGAIVDHLKSLCTTRRGSMLVAPRYGIDDVTVLFHEMPGGMLEIRRQLEEAIAAYEPRLSAVSVVHVATDAQDLVLRYEIRASATVDGRVLPLRFTAAIDAGCAAVVT